MQACVETNTDDVAVNLRSQKRDDPDSKDTTTGMPMITRQPVSVSSHVTALQIIADEKRGLFRKLDIGLPNLQVYDGQDIGRGFAPQRNRPPRRIRPVQNRASKMTPDQDWGSVWPGQRTFHPAAVPLPIRQGFAKLNEVPRSKYANAELMKIPNFLHLTPPVIKKQCQSLRQWCTEWPQGDVEKAFPVTVTSSSYLHSSSSLRDHRARRVSVSFPLKPLKQHSKFNVDKFRRLVGYKFDEDTERTTLEADCCPYKVQNVEHAEYLMTVLFHESCRREAWEDAKEESDMVEFDYDLRPDSLKGDTESTQLCRNQLKVLLENGENESTLAQYKEAVNAMYDYESLEQTAEQS